MIVSIMQPAYLPWLGYFERIAMSDLHIVLDHVQIDKSSKTKFANRNKIRTKDGWTWLTVPIRTSGRTGELGLDRIEISDGHFRSKHWRSIEAWYARTPCYAQVAPKVKAVYDREWPLLAPLCDALTLLLLDELGIATERRFSSQMNVPGSKAELILNLCKSVGATTYVSGPFGRDYLDASAFAAANIELVFHEYAHPTYPQAYTGFEPYMTALDLVMNVEPERRRRVLRAGATGD